MNDVEAAEKLIVEIKRHRGREKLKVQQFQELAIRPVVTGAVAAVESSPIFQKAATVTVIAQHIIENLFAKLKHYKAIAMRADKLARNFKAAVTYVCTFLWLKLVAIK